MDKVDGETDSGSRGETTGESEWKTKRRQRVLRKRRRRRKRWRVAEEVQRRARRKWGCWRYRSVTDGRRARGERQRGGEAMRGEGKQSGRGRDTLEVIAAAGGGKKRGISMKSQNNSESRRTRNRKRSWELSL